MRDFPVILLFKLRKYFSIFTRIKKCMFIQFPLMSKCGKIARILEESEDEKGGSFHFTLFECPGGPDAFLFVAQFCYGMRAELTSKNVLMVHCIAEYLEMTEDYGDENLQAKADSFFHKFILRSWKDCILALQFFGKANPKDDTLHVVSKSLSALSTMVCTDPSLFGWPLMMYGSLQSPGGSILWNGINTGARIRSSVSDWWFEDVSCLSIQLFKMLIEKMKERGIRPENIAGAIMHYAQKYLPGLDRWQGSYRSRPSSLANFRIVLTVVDQKSLLENIEKLLPQKKGKSYCRFMLGLLRFSIILHVCQSCQHSLERRIGMQLELATLDGLLIPSFSDSDSLYDTDCVERIIGHFKSVSSATPFSPASFESNPLPSSNPSDKVSKLIDSYLAEVAPDVNLKPEKMCSLALALPESFRSLDDGLYRALDIYFKAHPWLSEKEREKLCNIIDYGKLSIDAFAHASHNERLPLRVVLQVLFFEQLQLRRAVSNCLRTMRSDNIDANAISNDMGMAGEMLERGGWVSIVRENRVLRVDLENMRVRVGDLEQEFVGLKQKMLTKERAGMPEHREDGSSSVDSPPTKLMSRKLGCMSWPETVTDQVVPSPVKGSGD